MRFTHVFDEEQISLLELSEKFICYRVEALDVGEKYRPRPIADGGKNGLRIHPYVVSIYVNENRGEPSLKHSCDVRHPCQRRNYDLPTIWKSLAKGRYGQQVR